MSMAKDSTCTRGLLLCYECTFRISLVHGEDTGRIMKTATALFIPLYFSPEIAPPET